MNIYKITRDKSGGWDTFGGAIVIAKSPEDAAKIHPDCKSKYFQGWPLTQEQKDNLEFYREEWVDTPANVIVTYLGIADPTLVEGDVILSSFHAG